MPDSQHRKLIIMGVSGSGKTTLSKRLAKSLGYEAADADDFHPPENIEKMRRGLSLTDPDRQPWLDALNKHLRTTEKGIVLACSALKEAYRKTLESGLEGKITWIYLKGDFELIYERMKNRRNHFMPITLLKSQFDDLEEPNNAIVVSISWHKAKIINHILKILGNE